MRAAEHKLKEEQRKKKMEDQAIENARKLKEQEEAAAIRRHELEVREKMRVMFREAQNKAAKEKSLDKRRAKELKIKMAKEQAELSI